MLSEQGYTVITRTRCVPIRMPSWEGQWDLLGNTGNLGHPSPQHSAYNGPPSDPTHTYPLVHCSHQQYQLLSEHLWACAYAWHWGPPKAVWSSAPRGNWGRRWRKQLKPVNKLMNSWRVKLAGTRSLETTEMRVCWGPLSSVLAPLWSFRQLCPCPYAAATPMLWNTCSHLSPLLPPLGTPQDRTVACCLYSRTVQGGFSGYAWQAS